LAVLSLEQEIYSVGVAAPYVTPYETQEAAAPPKSLGSC